MQLVLAQGAMWRDKSARQAWDEALHVIILHQL
jgi:hypothetical protein